MGAILIHNDLIYIPLSMLSEGHSSRRKQGSTPMQWDDGIKTQRRSIPWTHSETQQEHDIAVTSR